MAYFSLCTLKIFFYWLLPWMAWWEICYYFHLCSSVHNVSSFIWLILKIFTLSQFIFMCLGVILCFFYFGILWVSWICKFIDFFQIQKIWPLLLQITFQSFFSPPSGTQVTEMLDCFILFHSSPNSIHLFSVFSSFCAIAFGIIFLAITSTSLIFSCSASELLLTSSSVFLFDF